MCGIFGVLEHNPDSEPDGKMLEASAKLLAHRGPDHTGVFCEPGIGLAHTRYLSWIRPPEAINRSGTKASDMASSTTVRSTTSKHCVRSWSDRAFNSRRHLIRSADRVHRAHGI